MQHQPCSMFRTPAENPKRSSFFHRDPSEKETAMDGTRPKSSPFTVACFSTPPSRQISFLSQGLPLRPGDNEGSRARDSNRDHSGLRRSTLCHRHARAGEGKAIRRRLRGSERADIPTSPNLPRTDRRALFHHTAHAGAVRGETCLLSPLISDGTIFFRVPSFPTC